MYCMSIHAHQTHRYFLLERGNIVTHTTVPNWDGYTKQTANCLILWCNITRSFSHSQNWTTFSVIVFVCVYFRDRCENEGTQKFMMGNGDEELTRTGSQVYDRFFLFSKFLKSAGLIFISANSIECSWPFQWNQLIPCGITEKEIMGKRLHQWDIENIRVIFPHITHPPILEKSICFFITQKVKSKKLHNVGESFGK